MLQDFENTNTRLNIQHNLATRESRNKKLHQAQEENCDAVRSRGQQGTCDSEDCIRIVKFRKEIDCVKETYSN